MSEQNTIDNQSIVEGENVENVNEEIKENLSTEETENVTAVEEQQSQEPIVNNESTEIENVIDEETTVEIVNEENNEVKKEEEEVKEEKEITNSNKEKIMKNGHKKKVKEKDQTIVDSIIDELTTGFLSESSVEEEIANSNENIKVEPKDLELYETPEYKSIINEKNNTIIERKNDPESIILTKDTPSIIKENGQDITEIEENFIGYENKNATFNNSTEEIYEIIIEEVVQYDNNESYPSEFVIKEPMNESYEIIIEDVIQELENPKQDTNNDFGNNKNIILEENSNQSHYEYIVEDVIQENNNKSNDNNKKNNDSDQSEKEIIEYSNNKDISIQNCEPKQNVYEYDIKNTTQEVKNDEKNNVKNVGFKYPNEEIYEYEIIEDSYIDESVQSIVPKEEEYEFIIEDVIQEEIEPKVEKDNIENDDKNIIISNEKEQSKVSEYSINNVIQEEEKTNDYDIEIKEQEEEEEITEIEENIIVEFVNNNIYPKEATHDEVKPEIEKENIKDKNITLEDPKDKISEIIVEDTIQEKEKPNSNIITILSKEVNREEKKEPEVYVYTIKNVIQEDEKTKENDVNIKEKEEKEEINEIEADIVAKIENDKVHSKKIVQDKIEPKVEKESIEVDDKKISLEDQKNEIPEVINNDITQKNRNVKDNEIIDVKEEEKDIIENEKHITEIENNINTEKPTEEIHEVVINETIQKDNEVLKEKCVSFKEPTAKQPYEVVIENTIQMNINNYEKEVKKIENDIQEVDILYKKEKDETDLDSTIYLSEYVTENTNDKDKSINEITNINSTEEIQGEEKNYNREEITEIEENSDIKNEEVILKEKYKEFDSDNITQNNIEKDETVNIINNQEEKPEDSKKRKVVVRKKYIRRISKGASVGNKVKEELKKIQEPQPELIVEPKIDVKLRQEISSEAEQGPETNEDEGEISIVIRKVVIEEIILEDESESESEKYEKNASIQQILSKNEDKNKIIISEVVEQIEPQRSEVVTKGIINKDKYDSEKLRKKFIKKMIHRDGETPINEKNEIVTEKVIEQVEPQKGRILIEESFLKPVEPQKCEVLIEESSEQVESQQEKSKFEKEDDITEKVEITQEDFEYEIIDQVEPLQGEIITEEIVKNQNGIKIKKDTKKNKKSKPKKKSLIKRILNKLSPHKKDKSSVGRKNVLNKNDILTNDLVTESKEEIVTTPIENNIEEQPIEKIKEEIVEQMIKEQPINEIKNDIIEQVEPREVVVEEQLIEEKPVEIKEEIVEKRKLKENLTEEIKKKGKSLKDENIVFEKIVENEEFSRDEINTTKKIKHQRKQSYKRIIKRVICKNGKTYIEEPIIENVTKEITEPHEYKTVKEVITTKQGKYQKKKIHKRIIKRIVRRNEKIISIEIEELPNGESTILKEEEMYSSLPFLTKNDDIVLYMFIIFGKEHNELLQRLELASNDYSMNKISVERYYNIYITILEELCMINGSTDKRYQSRNTPFMKEQSNNLWNSIANSLVVNEEEEEELINNKNFNHIPDEIDDERIYNKRRSCLTFFRMGSKKRHSLLSKHKKSKSFDYNHKNINNMDKNKKQKQEMFEIRDKYIQNELEGEKVKDVKKYEIENHQQNEEEIKKELEEETNNKEKEEITFIEMLNEGKNSNNDHCETVYKKNELTENETTIQITIPPGRKKKNKERKRWWKRKSNKNSYMKKEE